MKTSLVASLEDRVPNALKRMRHSLDLLGDEIIEAFRERSIPVKSHVEKAAPSAANSIEFIVRGCLERSTLQEPFSQLIGESMKEMSKLEGTSDNLYDAIFSPQTQNRTNAVFSYLAYSGLKSCVAYLCPELLNQPSAVSGSSRRSSWRQPVRS